MNIQELPKLRVRAPSKVNLFLDIQGRADNGYHLISSVICPCTLADEIELELSNEFKGVRLQVDLSHKLKTFLEGLAADEFNVRQALNDISGESNLAHKAAMSFLSLPKNGLAATGVRVLLKKNSPFGAGMGGGSADAAAVLRGLNVLSEDPLNRADLSKIGADLGADIPAQLEYGLVHVGGFGEVVTTLAPIEGTSQEELENIGIVVVVPPRMVSTPVAYRALGFEVGEKGDQIPRISADLGCKLRALGYEVLEPECSESSAVSAKKACAKGAAQRSEISLTFGTEGVTSSKPEGESRFFAVERLLGNSFDEVVSAAYPEISQVRAQLQELGAHRVMMTGSGSGLCCYFPTAKQAEEFAERLESGCVSKCFVSVVRLLPDAFSWAVAKR